MKILFSHKTFIFIIFIAINLQTIASDQSLNEQSIPEQNVSQQTIDETNYKPNILSSEQQENSQESKELKESQNILNSFEAGSIAFATSSVTASILKYLLGDGLLSSTICFLTATSFGYYLTHKYREENNTMSKITLVYIAVLGALNHGQKNIHIVDNTSTTEIYPILIAPIRSK